MLPRSAASSAGLLRQRATQLLDPRLALERAYAGAIRAQRALEFVEFLEQQQPTIAATTSSLLGIQRRARNVRTRVVGLGWRHWPSAPCCTSCWLTRSDAAAMLPGWMPYTGVHYGLLVLLVVIVVVLLAHMRRLNRPE